MMPGSSSLAVLAFVALTRTALLRAERVCAESISDKGHDKDKDRDNVVLTAGRL